MLPEPNFRVTPDEFVGRTQEIEILCQALQQGMVTGRTASFAILGDWGIGKSSLLLKLTYGAKDACSVAREGDTSSTTHSFASSYNKPNETASTKTRAISGMTRRQACRRVMQFLSLCLDQPGGGVHSLRPSPILPYPFPLPTPIPLPWSSEQWRMDMKHRVICIRQPEAHSLLKHLSSPPFNPRRETRFRLKTMIRQLQSCNPKMQLVQSHAQRRRAQARRYLCLDADFKEGGYS